MTGTGEIVNGTVHIHAVMAIAGDQAVAGHSTTQKTGPSSPAPTPSPAEAPASVDVLGLRRAAEQSLNRGQADPIAVSCAKSSAANDRPRRRSSPPSPEHSGERARHHRVALRRPRRAPHIGADRSSGAAASSGRRRRPRAGHLATYSGRPAGCGGRDQGVRSSEQAC